MLKHINGVNLIYYIALGLSFLLPLIVFGTISEENLWWYFHSDALFLGSVYEDVFVHGTGFAGWTITSSPNFFPDHFMYGIIRFFAGDFRLAYIIFSTVQYNVIVLLFVLLFKSIIPNVSKVFQTIVLLLFTCFLWATIIHDDFLFTFNIFSPAYHNGVVINTLIAFNLLFRYLNSKKTKHLYLLFIIVFVGIFNDRLFLSTFIAPIILLLLANIIIYKYKSIYKLSIASLLSGFIGLVVFTFTKENAIYKCISLGSKFLNFSKIIPSFHKLIEHQVIFIKQLDFSSIVSLSLIITLVIMAYLLIMQLVRKASYKELQKGDQIQQIFILVSFASMFITLFTPVVNGYYLGGHTIRFNLLAYYLALFNLAFLGYYFYRNKAEQKLFYVNVGVVSFFLVLTGIATVKHPIIKNINFVRYYYPEKVRLVDEFAKEHNLKYGVAGYWEAKYHTMFSKEYLRVYTVLNSKMRRWNHAQNSNWYFKYDKGKYNDPVYNFIILDGVNEEAPGLDLIDVARDFAKPKEKLVIRGKPYAIVVDDFVFKRDDKNPHFVKDK